MGVQSSIFSIFGTNCSFIHSVQYRPFRLCSVSQVKNYYTFFCILLWIRLYDRTTMKRRKKTDRYSILLTIVCTEYTKQIKISISDHTGKAGNSRHIVLIHPTSPLDSHHPLHLHSPSLLHPQLLLHLQSRPAGVWVQGGRRQRVRTGEGAG